MNSEGVHVCAVEKVKLPQSVSCQSESSSTVAEWAVDTLGTVAVAGVGTLADRLVAAVVVAVLVETAQQVARIPAAVVVGSQRILVVVVVAVAVVADIPHTLVEEQAQAVVELQDTPY